VEILRKNTGDIWVHVSRQFCYCDCDNIFLSADLTRVPLLRFSFSQR